MLDFDEIINVLEATAGRSIRRVPLLHGMVRGLGRVSDAVGQGRPRGGGAQFRGGLADDRSGPQ